MRSKTHGLLVWELACTGCMRLTPLPCQPIGMKEDITPLIDAWQTQGFPWKAKVKATARKHQLQEKTIAQIVTLHKDLFDVLQQAGATFHPDPCQDRPEVCDYSSFCGISFATRRGLLAHQRRKHQIFSVEWQFLQGAVLLDYPTLAAAFGIYSQTTGIQSVFPCSFYARQTSGLSRGKNAEECCWPCQTGILADLWTTG